MAITVLATTNVVATEVLAKVNLASLMSARQRLASVCRQYWPSVPISQLFQAARIFAEPINEDGSPFEGILAGRDGKVDVDLEGTDLVLHIQWHKMDSGKYEINAYIM